MLKKLFRQKKKKPSPNERFGGLHWHLMLHANKHTVSSAL